MLSTAIHSANNYYHSVRQIACLHVFVFCLQYFPMMSKAFGTHHAGHVFTMVCYDGEKCFLLYLLLAASLFEYMNVSCVNSSFLLICHFCSVKVILMKHVDCRLPKTWHFEFGIKFLTMEFIDWPIKYMLFKSIIFI